MLTKQFIWGVDLGEVRDYTGIAAIRVRMDKGRPYYTLGLLERFNSDERGRLQAHARAGLDFYEILGSYLLAQFDDLTRPYHGNSAVVVDGTGSGRDATIRFLRGRMARTVPLYPLQIRSADTLSSRQRDSGFIQVTRKDLLTSLASVLDSGRLRAVDGLALWPELRAEMVSAQMKERRGGGTPDTVRIAKHDDLALALAMAVWLGDRLSAQGAGGYVPVRYA